MVHVQHTMNVPIVELLYLIVYVGISGIVLILISILICKEMYEESQHEQKNTQASDNLNLQYHQIIHMIIIYNLL